VTRNGETKGRVLVFEVQDGGPLLLPKEEPRARYETGGKANHPVRKKKEGTKIATADHREERSPSNEFVQSLSAAVRETRNYVEVKEEVGWSNVRARTSSNGQSPVRGKNLADGKKEKE